MFKTANVGTVDRIIRLVAGAILVLLPFIAGPTPIAGAFLQWALPLVGLVLIATAIVRFCPLYRLIGASTCKTS